MATSKAQQRASYKWDSVHSFRFSVKMGRDEADALKAACQADGVTPHAFFLRAARDLIAAHAGSVDPSALGDADANADGDGVTASGDGDGDEDADEDGATLNG